MSLRAQERKIEEEPALGKPRSACLGVKKLIERKTNLFVGLLRTARGIKSWAGILFQGGEGSLRETGSRAQQRIIKSGKKTMIRFKVQGNLCEMSRTNLQGRGWTATICKSPTQDTSEWSSRISDIN